MPRDSHGFTNEIKNYELIRDFIRQLFQYGDLSTKELSASKRFGSQTNIYAHLKRIQNYLDDDRLRTSSIKENGKTIKTQSIIHDPLNYPINNLTESFQECTFNVKDIIFYYTFMQLFKDKDYDPLDYADYENENDDSISILDCIDEITDSTYSTFTMTDIQKLFDKALELKKEILYEKGQLNTTKDKLSEKPFSDQTFRRAFDKLNDELGIIINTVSSSEINKSKGKDYNPIRDGKIKDKDNLYHHKLSNDIFEHFKDNPEILNNILDMVCFFYNHSDIPVPGWQLANTLRTYIYSYYSPDDINNPEDPIYQFPDNNALSVLDSDVFWDCITAIHQHNTILFEYHVKETALNITAYPIKVISERQYGRQYLFTYQYESQKYCIYRLDRISNVQALNMPDDQKYSFIKPRKYEDVDSELEKIYASASENSFNTDIGIYDTPETILLHFKTHKDHIEKLKKRITNRTTKGIILNEKDESFDYKIVVNNSRELIPWIREFGPLVTVDSETCPDLHDKIKDEITEILKRYESV